MFRNLLNLAVFLVGLAVVCWIGAGYAASNPLALAVALLIGACYLAGALELYRYRQATATLAQAVSELAEAPSSLGEWLGRLPASLRNAVRLRIEGERVALPGPALAPYLVGLLVLLGMLGTLLGMMATLRGTGVALESTTDLQAIRDSLAAPVKGLGFAFGTSIAGVAASAMLGLLSALCRRERLQAAQALDARIATTLRMHSQAYQREEAFKLLQRQAEAMPALVDRLQEMMAAIERHGQAADERLAARQAAFHDSTEAAYARLAASVEQSLKQGVAESARAAAAVLQPAVQATMAALARETAALQDSVAQAVQRQLQELSAGFGATTTTVADIWNRALAGQRQSNEALAGDLRGTLDRFAETFEQRSAQLLQGVSARLDDTMGGVADAWNQSLSRQEDSHRKLVAGNQEVLAVAAAAFERHLQNVSVRLDDTVGKVADAWSQALSRQEDGHRELAAGNQQALAATVAAFERHSASLLRGVDQSHAQLQAALAAHDRQRLDAWSETLAAMTAALRKDWEQAGAQVASRQQEICDTLARTAGDISAQAQRHAGDTIAEVSRLVQAASEAPRAAAEVIAELRQKLSDSMARDTAMLEERNRLMATLETLLDGVTHASTEQRAAIDALVATSADLLERASTRFTGHVEAETGKLGTVAAQVTASAVEVASLGEAFGAAVQLFAGSNDELATRLQGIETALDKSLARSDEQLAYYVAQAREVVELSMLAQKQIIEDLQQFAGRQDAVAGAEAA